MPFEEIENQSTSANQQVIPPDGVRVSSRGAKARGEPVRYIKLQIGALLAKRLCLTGAAVNTKLMFGTGQDAGKIRLSVDVSGGTFLAKRDKQGRYSITLNRATADGLFSLDFPAFTVDELNIEHAQNEPPATVFKCSDEMLAVED